MIVYLTSKHFVGFLLQFNVLLGLTFPEIIYPQWLGMAGEESVPLQLWCGLRIKIVTNSKCKSWNTLKEPVTSFRHVLSWPCQQAQTMRQTCFRLCHGLLKWELSTVRKNGAWPNDLAGQPFSSGEKVGLNIWMAWCKRDLSDFFRWIFFSFKSAWIFACVFQLSRKTFSCMFFSGWNALVLLCCVHCACFNILSLFFSETKCKPGKKNTGEYCAT